MKLTENLSVFGVLYVNVVLENEVLQLHLKPVYYLISIYLLYIGHSKHFIMVVRKLLFVV